jgi:tetratricopeptide (TPR) repeat protein
MHHLGTAHALPSLWTQMPRFFAYPCKPNGLVFLALLALLTILAARLFDKNSLLILLPIFIIGSLTIRQGLRVVEFCGQGRSRPPSVPELFDGNPATLKMLGLIVVYGLMVGALSRFGLFGLAGIACVSLLLPASIMLLAIHGSLRGALDPIQVVQLAARTGWSYLGLVLVLVITAQGPQRAIALIPATMLQHLAQRSPELLGALLVVSTAYFNMVMGAMMGYLVFQHHEDLGVRADAEHKAGPADKRALELARAVILVRESRYDDALRQMAGMVADYPNDLGVMEYHHKLLCESGAEAERVIQHTERFLQALVTMQRRSRMIAVLEAARRIVPQYQPKSIAVRTALAGEYFLQRQFKPAIALLGMLHKEAPTSDELPAAYFMLARIYSEGVRDDGKALMMLDYLLQHFPGHALAGEITHYRSVIVSLRQAPQAGVYAAT